MEYVSISLPRLAVAFGLVLVVIGLSLWQRLGLAKDLLWASARAFLQLAAIGYVLTVIFDLERWYLILLLLGAMLTVAVATIARQKKGRVRGVWPVLTASLIASVLFTLAPVIGLILGISPWYKPQYLIPIAGMLLGNAVTGSSLATERLLAEARLRKLEIEAALSLGATWLQASKSAVREATKAALIPTINMLMIAGVVQLPGMMTGQILAGAKPWEAVKYQIMILYAVAAAVAVASLLTAFLSCRRLFTRDHQLIGESIR